MTDEQPADVAIRTPDQRLRVFVSSTLAELANERAAVARAVSALRLTPVLFELGARPHPPREVYRAYLAQSDVFVGLYWQRYGWVGPGMDISGLEDEFRLSHAIPRLLYVKAPAPDREPGLTALIEELETDGTDSYRTFATPEELGQLVQDDLALLLSERFAATGSRARRPRSLPAPSTTLIGRGGDIAQVCDLLLKPEVRLVTLTGPGGIGKTRLAIAVGERLDDRYPQGAVFVALASVDRPELVPAHVADAAGVTIAGARTPVEALAEQFADTPTLLVLDNLEQVVGVAPDLDELLARCPRLDVLATSRTALRLRAEREYTVGPLTVPAVSGGRPIEQVASSPAVQLFVDRAQAVSHGFALTDDNALAIVEICRRLDGLPLAIELAAARARLLEPDALLARLGSRLDALGTGPVDLPERQRTMRATVEWSVGLLDDAEQRMLATLSIFVDGWTIEAAAHVAALTEDRTLDLLDSLAGHSLVDVDATDAGLRFRMLSAIRELAAERLAAGTDVAEVGRRHAEYFGALVVRGDGTAERSAEWAERLRAEDENLGVAIRWFFTHDIAPLPHMFLVLCRHDIHARLFWLTRDRTPEGRAWIEEILLRADALEPRVQAELLLISAVTAVEIGDDDSAHAAVEGIERLERRIDDPYLGSAAKLAVSWVLPIADDVDGALQAASAALDGFREQNEPLVAWAALTVGLLEMALGRHDTARAHLTEADELGGEFGNRWLAPVARTQLASLAAREGRLEEARRQLAVSLADDGSELSTQAMIFSLVAYARLALAEGDARRAATALGAVDGLRRSAGLHAWPSMRRDETELTARVSQAAGRDGVEDAFAAGSALTQPEGVALVRGGVTAGN
jgi:predicted ATPase